MTLQTVTCLDLFVFLSYRMTCSQLFSFTKIFLNNNNANLFSHSLNCLLIIIYIIISFMTGSGVNVTVIVVENGISKLSSNPGRSCLFFLALMLFGKP